MELRKVDCAACGSSRARIWNTCRITAADSAAMAGREAHLVRCCGCGLIYLDPQPCFSPGELEQMYSGGYFRSYGVGMGESYGYRLAQIEEFKAQGSMLEVGCGDGGFLETAQARGWETAGVDVSAYAVSAAASKGVRAVQGTLGRAGFPVHSFDAAVCADVLEHAADPAELLRQAHRVLKPQGILYISLPNIASVHYRLMGAACRFNHRNYFLLPYHVYHFSPATLERLCSRCGFRIARFRRTQSAYPGRGLRHVPVRLVYSLGRFVGRPDRMAVVAVKV